MIRQVPSEVGKGEERDVRVTGPIQLVESPGAQHVHKASKRS